jgi:hypothetical protein
MEPTRRSSIRGSISADVSNIYSRRKSSAHALARAENDTIDLYDASELSAADRRLAEMGYTQVRDILTCHPGPQPALIRHHV